MGPVALCGPSGVARHRLTDIRFFLIESFGGMCGLEAGVGRELFLRPPGLGS